MEQKNEKKKIVSEARFKFAVTSLHKYATIKPKENIVFSPYNIYHGLYSVYLISSGEMEQRLKEILYLPADVSKNELMNIINFNQYDLTNIINFNNPAKRPEDYKGSTFCMPYYCVVLNTCIFLNKILRENIETIKELYNVGFESIISNNMQDTNRELNKILQSLIKNHFRKPVNLKIKTEDMDIFLANVHNLKGRNQSVSETASGSTDAPSLSTPSYLNIKTFSSIKLHVKVKEIIIKKHMSLYILIPFSSRTIKRAKRNMSSISLSRLIKRLSTSKGMNMLQDLLSCNAGKVKPVVFASRPIFEIEQYLDMRVLLRELGVEQLLTPDPVSLDNSFAEDDQSVHFGNAVHRARVKVMQEDVKAFAVTVISGQEPCSNDIITDMNIKNPFLWLIYDKMHADILYIGAFNEIVSQTGLTGINETQASCSS